MKTGIIYKILNSKTNDFYIGSSLEYNDRKVTHFRLLKQNKHHCIHLQNAFNKYGIDCFSISIVEEFKFTDKQYLLEREQFYLDTLKPHYNICKIAGSPLGRKMPENSYKLFTKRIRKTRELVIAMFESGLTSREIKNTTSYSWATISLANKEFKKKHVVNNNRLGKRVINTITGEIHNSISEVAKLLNVERALFAKKLNNKVYNNTNFKLL